VLLGQLAMSVWMTSIGLVRTDTCIG
jgi:hypothetical protein